MKNKISILFLFILLLQFFTQTSFATEKIGITQLREQIPERWEQEYQAHGRTIAVDVSPMVPEVDAVPIFKVAIDTSTPDISKLSSDWTSEVSLGTFSMVLGDPNAEINKIQGKYETVQYYPPLDFEKVYTQNNPVTLGEVIVHLETIMNDVDHGEWNFKHPDYLYMPIVKGNTDKNSEPLSRFVLVFKQKLDGIPLLHHVRFSIDEPKKEPPALLTGLLGVFRTSNDISLGGHKVEIQEVLVDDVPICNFSEVQKSIEKEILEGRIRRIYDVEFGYVLYNHPGATIRNQSNISYYTIPMWIVNCHYVPSPRTELRDYTGLDVPERNIMEYKQLFINAQTGEAIDRRDTRKDIADYTGFLSWEDVEGKP